MKRHRFALPGLLLAVSCGAAHSQTAWLLESRWNHFAVVRAQGQTVRDIVALRDAAPNYGESRRVVVAVAAEWVHVIDKESATVTSFQLAVQPQYVGYPVSDLSGPLENMLVTDEYAFFPTIRAFEKPARNELGGQYDIVQVSLADGSLRSIPLPDDSVGPRLAEVDGVSVAYAWSGDRAWTLDFANGRVVRILQAGDVADLRMKEAAAPRTAGGAPRAFVRYVIVSGAGAFRLSSLGELAPILDEHLARIPTPAASVWLGPAHDVLAVRAGTADGSPAIGVVRREADPRLKERRMKFSYLHASSLDVVWESAVAQGAIPESFYTADDGSVFYIDRVTGAVVRLSQEGSSTSWHLPAGQSDSARILSMDLEH